MLQELLGVEAVWCDMRSEDSSQQFVLWAGAVLDQRGSFEASLQGRRFAFSLVAHSDQSSPMLDFLSSSSVLQVGACRWAGGWGVLGWGATWLVGAREGQCAALLLGERWRVHVYSWSYQAGQQVAPWLPV